MGPICCGESRPRSASETVAEAEPPWCDVAHPASAASASASAKAIRFMCSPPTGKLGPAPAFGAPLRCALGTRRLVTFSVALALVLVLVRWRFARWALLQARRL